MCVIPEEIPLKTTGHHGDALWVKEGIEILARLLPTSSPSYRDNTRVIHISISSDTQYLSRINEIPTFPHP